MVVRGLTPAQIAEELQRRLLTYLKQPQVTVFVREVNSKKVTVYGQVRNPGAVSYADSMTISQAVTPAVNGCADSSMISNLGF